MNKISKIIILLSAIFFFSCKKNDLGNVDLGKNYPPYVHFTNATKQTVVAGGSAISIGVTIYIPQWQNFDVQYELRGNYNVSGSFTVESGKRADTLMLNIPVNPSVVGNVVDTLFLTSATNGVVIGRQNVAANNIIKKPIAITK
ncbi:MAG TPA: hypothetical protein PLW43_02350 [Chitinophagales bacterium]|jgi:hypothetical protein|nr:hypothetical protein [Chitinophagales bacterium]